MDEIRGNTFGVKIDLKNGTVHIDDNLITDDPKMAQFFSKAYVMGRDHKKMEIKMSLGV
jgi:hypothetical protein